MKLDRRTYFKIMNNKLSISKWKWKKRIWTLSPRSYHLIEKGWGGMKVNQQGWTSKRREVKVNVEMVFRNGRWKWKVKCWNLFEEWKWRQCSIGAALGWHHHPAGRELSRQKISSTAVGLICMRSKGNAGKNYQRMCLLGWLMLHCDQFMAVIKSSIS